MLFALASLFISAFLAATLLPLSSEVLLLALLREGFDPVLLIITASIGNTAGATVNWFLGRYLLQFQNRSWFYFSPQQISRAQHGFNRYGLWSLLFSWIPLVGDALTLIGGVMRVTFWKFVLLVGVGKTARYVVLASVGGWLFSP